MPEATKGLRERGKKSAPHWSTKHYLKDTQKNQASASLISLVWRKGKPSGYNRHTFPLKNGCTLPPPKTTETPGA